MRNKVIIGNWKMNKTISETKEFTRYIHALEVAAYEKGIKIGIAPSFLSLPLMIKKTKTTTIYAQNCHFENSGAYTGEVSIPMLLDIKVEGSLVGHSERRQYDNETDAKCLKKIQNLLNNDLEAVYCVGEVLADYEAGNSKKVVKKQLIDGLTGVKGDYSKLIIAYEPVWSIGTGVNASVQIAEEICFFIREELKRIFSPSVAEEMIILYGGSVKPENIKEYLSSKNIDGALVGGASLKPESFKGLIENSR